MSVKLLSEHHLEVFRLKGGCTGTSESTLVKMPHYGKCHGSYIDVEKYYMYATYNFTMCANFTKCEILV